MQNEEDFVNNIIILLAKYDGNDTEPLYKAKSDFLTFINYLNKNKNTYLNPIIKEIPPLIDIAIEIPNEIVRKSCIRMICEILEEIHNYYHTGIDEIIKKKLMQKISAEYEELNMYSRAEQSRSHDSNNDEIPSYEALCKHIVELNREIEKQHKLINKTNLLIHDIIKLMIHCIEVKEPYLLGHSMKVAYLACSLAKKIHTNIDIEYIKYSAWLHDIGRLVIYDKLILDKENFDEDDLKYIQQHTVAGYNAVKNLAFDQVIKDAVLYHHESYDGSGYPEGLKGKEIPIIARIIKIADVYDAITSDRPHRMGHSKQEALAIMYNEREKFDPEFLDAFYYII